MRCIMLVVLLATAVLLNAPSQANATVLTFDEFGTSFYFAEPLSNNYGGLNWSNFYVGNKSDYQKPEPHSNGIVNGTVSGLDVAFNSAGLPAAISNTEDFTFNGAYFTAAWNNRLNVEIRGFHKGNLRYDRTLLLNSYYPTFFTLDYSGIDTLTLDSFGGDYAGYYGTGTHFVMDNFTYNEPETAPVPEPSTKLLVGIGLMVGLAVFWRPRTRTATT